MNQNILKIGVLAVLVAAVWIGCGDDAVEPANTNSTTTGSSTTAGTTTSGTTTSGTTGGSTTGSTTGTTTGGTFNPHMELQLDGKKVEAKSFSANYGAKIYLSA